MSGSSPLEKRGQTFFFFKAVGKLPCGMIYQPLLRKYRLKVAIVPPLPSLKFLGRVGSPTFRPNFAPFHPLEFAVFFFFFLNLRKLSFAVSLTTVTNILLSKCG